MVKDASSVSVGLFIVVCICASRRCATYLSLTKVKQFSCLIETHASSRLRCQVQQALLPAATSLRLVIPESDQHVKLRHLARRSQQQHHVTVRITHHATSRPKMETWKMVVESDDLRRGRREPTSQLLSTVSTHGSKRASGDKSTESEQHRSERPQLNRHGLWLDSQQAHASNTLHNVQHAD